MIDSDKYLDNQLNKYYEEQESNMPVSNCCGATTEEQQCYCPECKSGCVVITYGEYMADKYENAQCDAGDAQRELEREFRDEE